MTTIVYDHKAKQIAVDGRTTAGSTIKTDSDQKWVSTEKGVWFIAGSTSDTDRFIEYMESDNPEPPRFKMECSAILATRTGVYVCGVTEEGEPWMCPTNFSDAMGSGEHFALAALDFGCSSREAVEYAATRDSSTGGRVTVFDVDKMEFVVDTPVQGGNP